MTLHDENSVGDIGSVGSLHRLLRGLSLQRAQKRDEFISAELTNHLFQSECMYRMAVHCALYTVHYTLVH